MTIQESMTDERISREESRPVAPRVRQGVLAICGGGNAAHTLAVVASQHFDGEIVWLCGSPEKAELLRRGVFSEDGLRATGAVSGRADRVRSISSDPAEIIPVADVVVIAAPAFAHAPILSRITPHLKEDALVGAIPARSGFEFEAAELISGIRPKGRRTIFGLQTLPWFTRIQQPARIVRVGARKAKVLMATLPHGDVLDVAARLTDLLGVEIVATPNFLGVTLGNPGQIIHPGIMYGHFAEWSGETYREEEIPRFYADVSDLTGEFMETLSTDVVAVAQTIQAGSNGQLDCSGVLPIHDWLRTSYPTQTADPTTVATCLRTGPVQSPKVPVREVSPGRFVPDFHYRYLSEDVPYGLVVAKAMAQLAGVETAAVDAVIGWTQGKIGKRYLVDGILTGADVHALRVPQNYGIRSLEDLVDWYIQWSGLTASVPAT